MKKFLIIQTAFIGDVVLALPVAQTLREEYPHAEIHLLVRKGNESLAENHPAITKVWTRNKKEGKLRSLTNVIRDLRTIQFDAVYNLHRFASSGWISFRMKSKEKIGFDKNPFSFLYTRKVKHEIPFVKNGKAMHEVQRNLLLLDEPITAPVRPLLYPSEASFQKARELAGDSPYIVIAPASVWFTKQLHESKWAELIAGIPATFKIFLIGAKEDAALAERLCKHHKGAKSLCGKLSFLDSAALMKNAHRVFANDSAPLHFASAMNAPVTAFFCSTISDFGFGPLSSDSKVLEVKGLDCRPCGIHGFKECPKGHFRCAMDMKIHSMADFS